MYCGYVVAVKDLRKHPNADRLQIATFFGNDVIVGLDVVQGEIGVYFPSDGQLSVEFCEQNNLVRKKDENGNNIGGYLDPEKRNIKAINLRGAKSDGIFMPMPAFAYTGFNFDEWEVGDTVTVLNGHEICQKYIPVRKNKGVPNGNKTRKKKVNIAPLFAQHADTEQLAYNLDKFRWDDFVEITLKMHGTSQRTGYLPVLKGYKRTFLDWLLRREGKPIYDWDYVCGTRRVVLEGFEDGGFYGTNEFRFQHHDKFLGKLHKGETVYYEIVGYANESTPIMGVGQNAKVGKDFVKEYGKTTTFSYGCAPGESKCYVYRMTMTNEDGDVVEYTPDFMRYRCEQMGVDCVPLFAKVHLDWGLAEIEDRTPGEIIKDVAEHYFEGPDPIGKTHIREGVVCRIVNRPTFAAYKHKNVDFKILSGIIKDNIEVTNNMSVDILSEM